MSLRNTLLVVAMAVTLACMVALPVTSAMDTNYLVFQGLVMAAYMLFGSSMLEGCRVDILHTPTTRDSLLITGILSVLTISFGVLALSIDLPHTIGSGDPRWFLYWVTVMSSWATCGVFGLYMYEVRRADKARRQRIRNLGACAVFRELSDYIN